MDTDFRELNNFQQVTQSNDGTGHYGPIVESSRALANPMGQPIPAGAPTALGDPRGHQFAVTGGPAAHCDDAGTP